MNSVTLSISQLTAYFCANRQTFHWQNPCRRG